MKLTLTAVLLALTTTSALANNVVVNGTRFIYPGENKEISIQLNNKSEVPAVMQSWLDVGNPDTPPDEITTPFVISPPIVKVDAKAGQTLRIRAVDKAGIAKDRESIWWLNTMEIPGVSKSDVKDDTNTLQMAIRSRFKFIYRPDGLGDVSEAPNQLVLKTNGSSIDIENPTPFYITINKVSTASSEAKLNKETVMVGPKENAVMKLTKPVNKGEALNIITINDYGSDAKYNVTTK